MCLEYQACQDCRAVSRQECRARPADSFPAEYREFLVDYPAACPDFLAALDQVLPDSAMEHQAADCRPALAGRNPAELRGSRDCREFQGYQDRPALLGNHREIRPGHRACHQVRPGFRGPVRSAGCLETPGRRG